MARIRSVKPDLCTSETMAALSADVERTFVRLWTECDDEGRCRDHPQLLKASLFPLHDNVTPDDVDDHLDALAGAGCIVRYVVDGKRFLAVPSWPDHQHPQKPRKSTIPTPDQGEPYVSDRRRVLVPEASGPVVEGRVEVGVDGEVGVADPVNVSGQPQVVAPEPSLDAEQLDQLTNRAVGLLANLRAIGGDNPGGLARHIGETLPEHERAELRDLIAAGADPRDAAAELADPLRGLDPATARPGIDPAAVAAAADAAKRRETATKALLAAQRAEVPAPPPANLRTHLRAAPDPREATA